jgi:hypothetical protein
MKIRRDIVEGFNLMVEPNKEGLSKLVTTCSKGKGVLSVEGNKVVIQYLQDDMEELTITGDSYQVRPTSRAAVFPDEYSTIKFNPMD